MLFCVISVLVLSSYSSLAFSLHFFLLGQLLLARERDAGHDVEIVTDILGLASCDAIVGTMTSQVIGFSI